MPDYDPCASRPPVAGEPEPRGKPPERRRDSHEEAPQEGRRKTVPPDSIPNPMPGVDPQQTPGIDHLPAEQE